MKFHYVYLGRTLSYVTDDYTFNNASSLAFSLFGVAESSLPSLRSLIFFSLYSVLLHVFSFNIHLSLGLPIFQCPLTSMFPLLRLLLSYLSVSTHFHVPIATSSSVLSFSVHSLPCSHCYVFFCPTFQCPLTSMFPLLCLLLSYLSVSTHFHVPIATSSSVFPTICLTIIDSLK